MHRYRRLPGGRCRVPREARAALRPCPRPPLRETSLSLDLDLVLAPNPSVFTGKGTNTYVLGHDQVVVIDPGPAIPEHLDRVEAVAHARGRTAIVLLTHHHLDHAEAAVEMARRLEAPLAAIQHLLAPRLDHELKDGDRLVFGAEALHVLATPGHCRDHACFEWTQAGAIFVGDLVAGEGFIVIDPPEGNMAAYLQSLRRVRDRAAAVLLPAHGPQVDNPAEYLDGYVTHRLARESKVYAALPLGSATTLEALLPLAYDDTPQAMYPIAARSLQAHLDKLVVDRRVAEQDGEYRRLP